MGINSLTAKLISKHLPARVLSLGYPDQIERLDMRESVLHCVDAFQHQGCEEVVDLGVPCDLGKWGLVLDLGTTEHVANAPQCVLNAAEAVQPLGRIIHHVPMTMVNHGYWSVNPVFWLDFYRANKWSVEVMEFTTNGSGYHGCEILPWDGLDRARRFELPPETLALVVAVRTNPEPVALPRCEAVWSSKVRGGVAWKFREARSAFRRMLPQ